MSTSCSISLIKKNGDLERTTCHFDGYPSYVGAILQTAYNNPKKAKQMVNQGSMSSLGYSPKQSNMEKIY